MSLNEKLLFPELQKMLAEEGLLANANDVVVVAARSAWPEYNKLHAYVCQPNRPFQQVTRLGFYSKGSIHPLVPRIVSTHDDVEIKRSKYDGDLGELVTKLLEDELRPEGGLFKVLLLSETDSPETLKLANPIPNDKLSKSGKTTAFTMGQRYVASEALKSAKTTSDFD